MELSKDTIQFLMNKEKNPVIEIDGLKYNVDLNNKLFPIINSVKYLEVETLSSIIDYIKLNIDNMDKSKLFIHIESEKKVSLKSYLKDYNFRETIIVSEKAEDSFRFNAFMSHENFIIGLSTSFILNKDLEELLNAIGRVSNNAVKTISDDGLSQEITVKKGLELNGYKKIPTILNLKPYRTFFEVDQPESSFLVRAKEGKNEEAPEFALFEADGGFWKNKAKENIYNFLKDALNIPVIV